MKPFRRFVLACRGFAIYGTARADLLCTCVAGVRVQTLVAFICRSACAVAWRRRLPPYLDSPSVCDRSYSHQSMKRNEHAITAWIYPRSVNGHHRHQSVVCGNCLPVTLSSTIPNENRTARIAAQPNAVTILVPTVLCGYLSFCLARRSSHLVSCSSVSDFLFSLASCLSCYANLILRCLVLVYLECILPCFVLSWFISG